MNRSRLHHALLSAAFALAGITATGTAAAVDTPDLDKAASQIAVHVCSNCHGPGGRSVSPVFPRLAGQQELYLQAQIKAFRAHERGDPEAHDYMWGMATLIDDPMVGALSSYFSKQTPVTGTPGDPVLMEKGKQLFLQGSANTGQVACASCHGEDAHGRAIFPRLAGQHAAYLERELNVIQTQLRTSPIMHGIVKNLSPEEIHSVAIYLQSLS